MDMHQVLMRQRPCQHAKIMQHTEIWLQCKKCADNSIWDIWLISGISVGQCRCSGKNDIEVNQPGNVNTPADYLSLLDNNNSQMVFILKALSLYTIDLFDNNGEFTWSMYKKWNLKKTYGFKSTWQDRWTLLYFPLSKSIVTFELFDCTMGTV